MRESAAAADPELERALATLVSPGLLIGHRVISPGDENALLATEATSMASPLVERRRASGAARIVTRKFLARLGHPDVAVPRGASGEPVWPAGFVGSLAHDDAIAVGVVASRDNFTSVGIDVEPAVPMAADMIDLVATPAERAGLPDDPLRATLLFAAKEAVYKAAYPLDHSFLEFHDIEVDIAARRAVTRAGRVFMLRTVTAPRIVVLALTQA